METTDSTSEQGTSLSVPEGEVYPAQWRPSGDSSDSSIPPGIIGCQRCKLPFIDGEKTSWLMGQHIHTHTMKCVERLRIALDEAGKELEESRAGSVFGSYNTLSNESALMSGPRFIDIVREMLHYHEKAALTPSVLDMAYTLVHGGLRFEPDNRSSYASREYDLAGEFVVWALSSKQYQPRWLRGVF